MRSSAYTLRHAHHYTFGWRTIWVRNNRNIVAAENYISLDESSISQTKMKCKMGISMRIVCKLQSEQFEMISLIQAIWRLCRLSRNWMAEENFQRGNEVNGRMGNSSHLKYAYSDDRESLQECWQNEVSLITCYVPGFESTWVYVAPPKVLS